MNKSVSLRFDLSTYIDRKSWFPCVLILTMLLVEEPRTNMENPVETAVRCFVVFSCTVETTKSTIRTANLSVFSSQVVGLLALAQLLTIIVALPYFAVRSFQIGKRSLAANMHHAPQQEPTIATPVAVSEEHIIATKTRHTVSTYGRLLLVDREL